MSKTKVLNFVLFKDFEKVRVCTYQVGPEQLSDTRIGDARVHALARGVKIQAPGRKILADSHAS